MGQRITMSERLEIERKPDEKALRETEERYRSLVESNFNGIVIYSKRKIVFINNAGAELLGAVNPEQLIGKPIMDFIPMDYQKNLKKKFLKIKREGKFIRLDGTDANVEMIANKVTYKNRPATQLVFHDITERERTTQVLINAAQQWRTTFDAISDAVSLLDQNGRILRCNKAMADFLGKALSRIIGCTCFEVMQCTSENIERCPFKSVKKSHSRETEVLSKDNRWLLISVDPLLDETDGFIGAVYIITDITDRKLVEEALLKSKEKYKTLIENVNIGVYRNTLGSKGEFIEANPTIVKMFGYKSKEEFLSINVSDLYQKPKDRKKLNEKMLRVGFVKNEELQLKRKDGTSFIGSVSAVAVKDEKGGVKYYDGIIEDITTRKRTEEALRGSEASYKELADSITDVFFAMDKDLRYTYWNKASEKLTEVSAKDAIGKSLYEIFPDTPETKRAARIYLNVLRTQQPQNFINEYHLKGKRFFFEINAYPSNRGISVFVKDITQRKGMEEEIRKLSAAVEQSIDGIAICDLETKLTYANDAFATMHGYSIEEMIGMKVENLHSEEQMDEYKKAMNQIKTQGSWLGEIGHMRKDGTYFFTYMSVTLLKDDDGNHTKILAVTRDITEHKKSEEELVKMQKLESIGILAGGIAHDFNNILTSILGNIDLVIEFENLEDKNFERLAVAEKAALEAKDLVQQLLTFSRGGLPVKKVVSMAELIKDSVNFALRGSGVRCKFTIPDDLRPVEVDEGQIGQVIDNLIINADQAMPEGGMIKVGAENITVGVEEVLLLQEGRYVKITIEDQGVGISKEHLRKIFDPYFTTKQKGSGLGLTISYSIIKNHNGYITVESELGVGSTFFIYLPASEKEIPEKGAAEERLFVDKGKILFMDDEEPIRVLAGQMLKRCGYKVEFVANGSEVVEFYKKAKESGESFDAVIIDLTVPGGMGGKETIKKLLKIDPEVKAIVSSGYSNDRIMFDFKQNGFSGVLTKPYKTRELSKLLHKVITRVSE